MNSVYEKYGYFKEQVISVSFEGLEGMEKIKNIMISLRNDTPKTLGGFPVTKVIDYKEGVEGLPSADVLRFELSDDTTLFIRPSGTEPKIKGYIMVKTPTNSESEEKLKLYKEELNKLFD